MNINPALTEPLQKGLTQQSEEYNIYDNNIESQIEPNSNS
jgi:hypothetical protein